MTKAHATIFFVITGNFLNRILYRQFSVDAPLSNIINIL